jgi:hypothetical protein
VAFVQKTRARDNGDLREFLRAITRKQDFPDAIYRALPTQTVLHLARVAKSSTHEVFQKSLTWTVFRAHSDAITLSKTVYRDEFLEQLDEILRPAALLEQKLAALLEAEHDPAILAAQQALSEMLDILAGYSIAEGKAAASILRKAIAMTKRAVAHELPERGRPTGAAGSGIAMDKFITRLEFAALAAGGKWTLDKNAEKGTLITALEELRDYLPDDFLPRSGRHPYSSYQRILTRARSAWRRSTLPTEMLEDHTGD